MQFTKETKLKLNLLKKVGLYCEFRVAWHYGPRMCKFHAPDFYTTDIVEDRNIFLRDEASYSLVSYEFAFRKAFLKALKEFPKLQAAYEAELLRLMPQALAPSKAARL